MDSFKSIPIIDVGEIEENNRLKNNTLVHQTRRAYSKIGFAYIVNHSIDQCLVENLFQKSCEFHSLLYEAKMK
ncbi:MAG: hypothetical protein CL935_00560 [Deltaproteobacteria bacterium]|nr:hypothetical protein [Deltaproteobacteria bacterium]